MAEKTTQELERIYTIPLREVKASPRNHAADRAIRAVKRYLAKHMKSEDVWIDASVNELIWARGMYTIPSKIRVRARKFDDGVIEVSLPDVETKASLRADLKARKEKKAEDKKKDDKKKDEAGEDAAEKKGEDKEKADASGKQVPTSGDKPKQAKAPETKSEPAVKTPKTDAGTTPPAKKEGGKAEKA